VFDSTGLVRARTRLVHRTPERGGRSKRFYRIEAVGERALHESAMTAQRVLDTIVRTLGKDWAKEWAREWGRGQ